MPQPPMLRRAVAWADRLLHAGARAAPPAPRRTPASATDTGEAAGAAPLRATPPDVPPAAAAGAPDPPPTPLDPHHREGLCQAAAHRWNWAQRALERAARAAPHGPAAADLASVRVVRRQLRVLAKWPRDTQAHLALGRAYFELGQGADAEQAFGQARALAPEEPAAHVLLALEYAYRGDLPAAEQSYAAAQARGAGLPPLATILAGLQATPADTPALAADDAADPERP